MKNRHRLFIIFVISLIFGCNKREATYYENGEVQSDVEMKDGVRHGKSLEYYDNGHIMYERHWSNGKLDGKTIGYASDGTIVEATTYKAGAKTGSRYIYFESGKLMEKQMYDDEGRLIDFSSYHENGERDVNKLMPIFFLDEDTLATGDQNKFYARLGNVDSLRYRSGKLYLSTRIDAAQNLLDTIATITSNKNRFEYVFTENRKSGRHVLYGEMVFTITRGDTTEIESFVLSHPYIVK